LRDRARAQAGRQGLQAGAAPGAPDRGGARAAGTHARPHPGLERADPPPAARLAGWGAATLGPCAHAAGVPRTRPGRAGGDQAAEPLRRDLREGPPIRPRGPDMRSVARLIERIEDEMDIEPTPVNAEHLRMVEALLFAASEPLEAKALASSLP